METFETNLSAVHHELKSLCSVRQSKRHKMILKKAEWRDNRHFWNVCRRNRNLVVVFDKVTVQPCSSFEMFCMLGSGYLSGVVIKFKRQ